MKAVARTPERQAQYEAAAPAVREAWNMRRGSNDSPVASLVGSYQGSSVWNGPNKDEGGWGAGPVGAPSPAGGGLGGAGGIATGLEDLAAF